MRVIQITPKLPPSVCGVGDYSVRLGNALRDNHNFELAYVAVNQGSEKVTLDEKYIQLAHQSSNSLVNALTELYKPGETAVILQFSGYAYAYRGLCFWLVRGLRKFLSKNSDVRLYTMFHEVWAPGPATSLAGWVGSLQRLIAKRLVALSSAVWTSRVSYKQMLESVRDSRTDLNSKGMRKVISAAPISSNFGELQAITPWNGCQHQMLLMQPPSFDSPEGALFWESWKSLCDLLQIKKTIAVGRCKALPPNMVEALGILPSEDISQLLKCSRFVMVQYYDGCLAKSSVFAAIAAHGSLCIMPKVNYSEADGIVHRTHYIVPEDKDVLSDPNKMQQLKTNIFDWYLPHNWAVTAAQYAKEINGSTDR